MRRLKNEFEKVCQAKEDDRDRRLLDSVQQAFLMKTKEYILENLGDAVKSRAFENLENALISTRTILEADIPSERRDSRILQAIQRAEDALAKIPERSRTKRQLLKENIKAKMDSNMYV